MAIALAVAGGSGNKGGTSSSSSVDDVYRNLESIIGRSNSINSINGGSSATAPLLRHPFPSDEAFKYDDDVTLGAVA